jgi:hypothetical protein
VNTRLALLGLRRTAGPPFLALALGVAWLASRAGRGTALVEDAALRRGLALEAHWVAFLAFVVPLLVLRAAAARARGETAWISTSRAGIARAEASLASGAVAAAACVVLLWTALGAARVDSAGTIDGFAGTAAGPETALLEHGRPLAWRADVDSDGSLHARIGVSLAIAPGGGGALRLAARREGVERAGSARVLPRGDVDVAVPAGAGPVDFELSLPDPGARGFVVSRELTLWRPVEGSEAARGAAQRVALAACAWVALAFGLGAWLRAPLVLLLMSVTWIAAWWSDGAPRWLPGGDLARALATAGEGRAAAPIGVLDLVAAAAFIAIGLALSARGVEGRP